MTASGGGGGRWLVRVHRGTVAGLHHLPDPAEARRRVRVMRPTDTAVVLGSNQDSSVLVGGDALSAPVVRRRSGGGVVLVGPDVTWVDLLVPRGDPLWDDDVVRAAVWVGRSWRRALEALGVRGATVHTGGLETGSHGALVCFAGVGPGEVLVGGRKLVGVSQRRDPRWIRIQTLVHHRFDAGGIARLVAPEGSERSRLQRHLADRVGVLEVSSRELVEALVANLPA